MIGILGLLIDLKSPKKAENNTDFSRELGRNVAVMLIEKNPGANR